MGSGDVCSPPSGRGVLCAAGSWHLHLVSGAAPRLVAEQSVLPPSLAASLQTGLCRAVTTELLGLVEREAAGRALIFPVPIVSRTASGSLWSPAVLQRPLLFCRFMLDPYSLCYKLSRFLSSSPSERAKLCFTFIFPSVQMKFKSLKFQSFLLFCGNWGGLPFSSPSLLSSSYPCCLYLLFVLPFTLLFIHPHTSFPSLLSCMQPRSSPLSHLAV